MHGRRKNYRAWDAQQCSQEPVAPRDALPEDDLVFFLLDLVPQIDLSPFHQYYAQELRGQPPFDVTMMVTLLVYAYSVGVCSSRRVAAACERNLALNETAPRWERLRTRSSTHGVNNSRPSPVGGPARLDPSLEPRRSAVLISALATGPPAGVGGGLGPFLAA